MSSKVKKRKETGNAPRQISNYYICRECLDIQKRVFLVVTSKFFLKKKLFEVESWNPLISVESVKLEVR